MSESLDSQLAEYTNNVISGIAHEKSDSANPTYEFTSLQEMVVNLNNLRNPAEIQSSQTKILMNIKKDWPHSNLEPKVKWRSSRQRSSTMAIAVAFATILIVAIIFPQLGSSEIGPATAQGGYIIPFLLVLSVVAIVAYLFSKKNDKK